MGGSKRGRKRANLEGDVFDLVSANRVHIIMTSTGTKRKPLPPLPQIHARPRHSRHRQYCSCHTHNTHVLVHVLRAVLRGEHLHGNAAFQRWKAASGGGCVWVTAPAAARRGRPGAPCWGPPPGTAAPPAPRWPPGDDRPCQRQARAWPAANATRVWWCCEGHNHPAEMSSTRSDLRRSNMDTPAWSDLYTRGGAFVRC